MDPCGTRDTNSAAYAISVSIPADGFSRGAPEPILPTESNLFQRTAVETLCASIADKVVGAADLRVAISTANVNSSLEQLVRIVMGIDDVDPRRDQLLALLKSHYAAAQLRVSDSNAALKSAFILACTAPTSAGVGL